MTLLLQNILFLNIFLFYNCFCDEKFFVNICEKRFFSKFQSSSVEKNYEIKYLNDDTNRTFQTAVEKGINDAFVKWDLTRNRYVNISKIRLLKLRNMTEDIKIEIYRDRNNKIMDFYQNFTKGWNEIIMNETIECKIIKIIVHNSTYDNFEIAELQILTIIDAKFSCASKSIANKMMIGPYYCEYLYTYDDSVYTDVAKIEYGGNCLSSSGNCMNLIKDSVFYVNDLWQPFQKKDLYLKLIFFKSFLIREIRIKQSAENNLDSILMFNQDSASIQIFMNNESPWTIIRTKIKTNWLKFLINSLQRNNSIFHGFYEIKAFSYLPKIKVVACSKSILNIKTQNVDFNDNIPYYFSPPTGKCALWLPFDRKFVKMYSSIKNI